MVAADWADHEQTVIQMKLGESWTWEDFAQVLDETTTMTARVSYPVHRIVEMGSRSTMPNGNPWTLLRRLRRVNHPQCGLVVHVGGPYVQELMETAFVARYPHIPNNVRFVATLDEAYELCGVGAQAAHA